MAFTVFDEDGNMLATNQYFSVGGGFVVNNETQVAENLYYRDIKSDHAPEFLRTQSRHSNPRPEPRAIAEKGQEETVPGKEKEARPPYLYATAEELHNICVENNLTIAQVVWENERAFRSPEEIEEGLMHRESGAHRGAAACDASAG